MVAITASKAVLLERADGKGGRWGKISTRSVSRARADDSFSTDSAPENTSEQNALSGVKSNSESRFNAGACGNRICNQDT